jgi:hypothetical protein
LKKFNYKEIFNSLDDWVSKNANGKYYPASFVDEKEDDLIVGESYGIQQNRKEIFEFVKKIKKKKYMFRDWYGAYWFDSFSF